MTGANIEPIRGRTDARTAALERLQHPTYGAGAIATADLEGQFRIATALANATEAMPKGYRKQPGAVLLALAWGQQHGVDILTAIQSVAFVEGKAVVDATMQRALAKRAGYSLTITVLADGAVVAVSQDGRTLGEASYSMEDAARAGLAGKRNWQQNPEDMLVARATTRAIRRFAPDVLLGMLVADEVDDAPDLVAELENNQGQHTMADEPSPVIPTATGSAAGEGESGHDSRELGEGPEADEPSPSAAGEGESVPWWRDLHEFKADLTSLGVRQADAIREAVAITTDLGDEDRVGTLDAIWRHPSTEFRRAYWGWVRSHEALT